MANVTLASNYKETVGKWVPYYYKPFNLGRIDDGNGSTDGTFIYTGFRPAYVMWKETSAGTHGWMIHDNARSTYNPSSNYLRADSAGPEGSYPFADFTSNGFKQRHTSTWANGNGVNYIYIAFAEIPFKYSNAR